MCFVRCLWRRLWWAPPGGVISEVCAKQTVVGSDFATIRTHPTYVVRKSALYVHALAVSVRAILWASGSADSELRNYVHTYVRTYVRRGAPWPDNLKTARSAVDPQSFLRAGPWAHIQVSGHTRLGLPGPGICDVKALGFKLRRFMRTRVDRAFRDQLPRACVFLFGRGQPGLGTYVHTYVRIRLAWRGRATSKLPGPVRGLRHDGRVVCVCVSALR